MMEVKILGQWSMVIWRSYLPTLVVESVLPWGSWWISISKLWKQRCTNRQNCVILSWQNVLSLIIQTFFVIFPFKIQPLSDVCLYKDTSCLPSYFHGIKDCICFQCIFEETLPKLSIVNFGNHNSQGSYKQYSRSCLELRFYWAVIWWQISINFDAEEPYISHW